MGCKKEGCVYITHHVVCGGETILKTITKKMQPGGGGGLRRPWRYKGKQTMQFSRDVKCMVQQRRNDAAMRDVPLNS